MKNVLRRQNHRGLLPEGIGIRIRTGVFVVDTATGITIHRHAVRHERIERNDLAAPVADDLCVGIAPKQQMRHERFSERERGHFRVWLVMEQPVERMVDGLFLAASVVVLVEMQWQGCNGLSQNTDAGVYRRHLHGRAFIDGLPCSRPAKHEGISAAIQ